MIPPRPPPTPEAMLKPLERLLRPLVRLLIRCGVTFPAAAELLRTVYVDTARRELGPAERTDSRVSLLTGVHRKELRRLRALTPDEAPPLVTRNSQLIATWLGAADYTDPGGAPLPLPRTGPAPSFEQLVASVTRDVRARAVLDDWLSQGLVSIDAAGQVSLEAAALLPQPGREEQLFYLARNLHDHLAAAAANVLAADSAPFVDRSVHYDGLTEAAAAALEAFGREAAHRVLLEVNRKALALAKDEAASESVTRRVNFGVYVFAAEDQTE
jgi:hypothetical protein